MTSLLDQLELVGDHLETIERDGEIVACVEWAWVDTVEDMVKCDLGAPYQSGDVLYVSNLMVKDADPRLMWQLRHKLPKARWIAGIDESLHLHAPKGVPVKWQDYLSSLALSAG